MKSQRATSMRATILLIIACVTLYGCARFKPTSRSNVRPILKGDNLTISPVDAPAQVKLNDFRFNPPTVEDITITKLSAPTDKVNVIFAARFSADKRLGQEIPLRPDGSLTILHDDGKNGDATANDHIFSAIVPMDFDVIAAQQKRVIATLDKLRKPAEVRHFSGRQIVKHEQFERATLDRLLNDKTIKLIPIGADTVDERRCLLITAINVVEDPARTFNPCTGVGTPMGKWTFGYLMQQMANEPVTGINPADFTRRWLNQWAHDQTINDFTVSARAAPMQEIINRWPKIGGRLDLSRAPLKLLAIVNRIDLANNVTYGSGNAGEARLVFGFINTDDCFPLEFTVIFEYGIPRHTCSEIKAWANQWLALGSLTLGSLEYNAALETITEQFVQANADPSKPNGSALNQLRTDEFSLAVPLNLPWELREFRLFATGSEAGHLQQATTKQTPDRDTYTFVGTPGNALLADWINANASSMRFDRHTVPLNLPPPSIKPFLGGASPMGFGGLSPGGNEWNSPGISDPEARFHFSLNTCNACHSSETVTEFYHINPAPFGSESVLSNFLIGNGSGGDFEVLDPVDGVTTRLFFDLKRRAQILHDFATQDCLMGIRFKPILMTH